MGVHDRALISTTTVEDRLSSLIEFLNGKDGITAVAHTDTISGDSYNGVLYSFDDTDISCFFGYKAEGLLYTGCWVKNGNTTIYFPSPRGNDSVSATDLVIHTYIDDACKYVTINDMSTSRGGLQTMLTDAGKILIGYGENATNAEMVDISTLTFEDVTDTARIAYTYTNMFPYEADSGSLDFLAQAYFVNGGVRKFTSTILKECSTVSILSTGSMPDPLPLHFAIGAHCLVPLDEGGNE